MISRRIFLLVPVILLLQLSSVAQTQFSGWLADFNAIKLNNKFSIHNDFQLRSSDKLEFTQTLLLRAGLIYHLNKTISVTAGYAFIHNRRTISNISGYADEHRIWEQLVFNHPLVLGSGTHARKGSLQHRLRLEQRFIPVSAVSNDRLIKTGDVYANRLRYFFRNITPIVPWNASGCAPFVALQNEIFVNIGDKSGVNGEFFDQNRAYVALGYRFHKKLDIEIGYMNQYINGRNTAFTNNHILQLAGYLRL